MGRSPCCDKSKVKRGTWSPEEDQTLKNYIAKHGTAGNWIALPQKAGLLRCGKSCRLRWLNYLRPDIRHGAFTQEESDIICNLYNKIGSRWSVIASQLQGRTDNDVKNYWNTKIKKKKITKSDNIVIENTNSTFQAISHPDPILPINEYSSSVSNEPVNFDMPAGSSGDFTFSSSHQELTSSRSFGFEGGGVNGVPIDDEGFRDYYSYGDLFSIFQC